MSRNLKLLLAAAAVVAIATPSLAAPPDHAVRQDVRDSVSNSTLVFRNDGKFLGKDPDVNVRFELLRDGYADEN
jgi:hypothetical protein